MYNIETIIDSVNCGRRSKENIKSLFLYRMVHRLLLDVSDDDSSCYFDTKLLKPKNLIWCG